MPATFSQALDLTKRGYPIRRASWGEGERVTFEKGRIPASHSGDEVGGVPRNLFVVEGAEVVMPSLSMNGSEWSPSMEDLLAMDWLALDQPIDNEFRFTAGATSQT